MFNVIVETKTARVIHAKFALKSEAEDYAVKLKKQFKSETVAIEWKERWLVSNDDTPCIFKDNS